MKLSGNTILITGGTSGIGRGLAISLSDHGNKVIICGRRQERLEEIKKANPEITTIKCDLTEAGQREYLIKEVIEKFPDFNTLINNAGIQLVFNLTKSVDVSRLREEVETNFIAPVHLTSLAIEHLQKQSEPVIVNISSGLAYTPLAFMPVYCATKAAVHSWSLSLRKQLEETGVMVYEIAPPSVDTELGHQRREDKSASHGGMPVNEFVNETLKALEANSYQVGIGPAANMMQQRENMFDQLNSQVGR